MTGAGGFIGSVILKFLNDRGIDQIVIVDDLPHPLQFKNLVGKKFVKLLSPNDDILETDVDFFIHFGANANTLESDWSKIYNQNVLSTRRYYELAKKLRSKFIFASSASVYGSDNGPLNQYAFSKLISEAELHDAMILRLFNVYGSNEYHKNRMASTLYHWYYQLKDTGILKLFENSNSAYRDFVHVEDVARLVCECMSDFRPGVYDVGTTYNISFETVADRCIEIFGRGVKQYIEMPGDLKKQYQWNTQAQTNSLIENYPFIDISSGIKKYFDDLKLEKRY